MVSKKAYDLHSIHEIKPSNVFTFGRKDLKCKIMAYRFIGPKFGQISVIFI